MNPFAEKNPFGPKLTAGQKQQNLVARESAFRQERAKVKAAEEAKTARLRALRLAKEAEEQETNPTTTDDAPAAEPPKPRVAPRTRRINIAP
jgi:hypothetical protein